MTIIQSRADLPPTLPISKDQPVLCCWNCSEPLAPLTPVEKHTSTFACHHCYAETKYHDGIWHSMSPTNAARFKRFVAEYEFIRSAEGRGSKDAAYYLALPYKDLSGKIIEQWQIRARTYSHLERYIVPLIAARYSRPLRILDLGAGNGWLSYRLSLLGHKPVAVDLLTNDRDGLAAGIHFASNLSVMFPRVQASLDQLPFEDASFDLAIFNASFHYSEDYVTTLGEAMRCVAPGGMVVIADTPWYQQEADGRKMVEEKHGRFTSTYGFASDSVNSLEFLTPGRLHDLAAELRLSWQVSKPFYGVRWAWRPLRAKLRGLRTPSKFHIYMAEVPA